MKLMVISSAMSLLVSLKTLFLVGGGKGFAILKKYFLFWIAFPKLCLAWLFLEEKKSKKKLGKQY